VKLTVSTGFEGSAKAMERDAASSVSCSSQLLPTTPATPPTAPPSPLISPGPEHVV
jgi:hypothetical protein